jgi:hypothetical protein
MIVIRISADVPDDRRIVLALPPEVPTGRNELTVSIESESETKQKHRRSSLADWAETHAEHWGSQLSAADVEGFTGRGT